MAHSTRPFLRYALSTALSVVPFSLNGAFPAVHTVRELLFPNYKKAVHPTIKLLIAKDIRRTSVEIVGKYAIIDLKENRIIGTRAHGKKKIFEATAKGLKWGEEFPAIFQLKIVPMDGDGTLIIDGTVTFGNLIVYHTGDGLQLVAELTIDDIVNALIDREANRDIEKEALAAVAIATRTNMLYLATKAGKNPYFDLEANSLPISNWKDPELYHPLAKKVIKETKNMILSQRETREDNVHLFPAKVVRDENEPHLIGHSLIISEAQSEALNGKNAAEILEVAFPSAKLMKINQS